MAAEAMPAVEQRLLQRAEALLENRDVSGARLVLERAVALGSARAAYRLAQTYDPRVLDAWGTLGMRGDPARARELYAQAAAGGIREAHGDSRSDGPQAATGQR
jgi:TPR repeat protein